VSPGTMTSIATPEEQLIFEKQMHQIQTFWINEQASIMERANKNEVRFISRSKFLP
jgi:hypothetical protein